MKYVEICWQDHYSEYGWVESVHPLGHENVTVGILISEDDKHYSVAQTMHKAGDMFADVLHIIKADVITFKELLC